MNPSKLRTLCELEWFNFNTGWPSEGMLDVPVVRRVWRVITGEPGHPDWFPYIDSWLGIAQALPSQVQFAYSR